MAEAPLGAVLVYDVPLLVEKGLQGGCDVVVVVDVSEDIQARRLVGDRGMAHDEARRRVDSQSSRAERLTVADVVLANTGSRGELERQVDVLRESLTERGGDRL